MKRKKVLFLSPLPPPYYGSALSSEMCLDILKNSRYFEVRNIKLNYSREMRDIGKINVSKIKGIFEVSKEIKKELFDFKPDIVYIVPATTSFGLIRDSYFARVVKKYHSGEIIFHLRSRVLEKDWNNKFFRRIISKMLRGERAIILGEELRGDLHNLILDDKVNVLANAILNEISSREFKRIVKERKKNKGLEILFLSNMEPTKGWMKVLLACRILDSKNIDFKCNFVGEWKSEEDKKRFFDFIDDNNLRDKVFYLGKKTGKEKNEILKKSNVLVFPTEYPLETFGRVIIEAMMFGIAVIANGIATIPSIVDDKKCGFVLKENTPKEIANYLIELLDEKKREKMGLMARKRFLKEFELKKYKKKFIEILRRD